MSIDSLDSLFEETRTRPPVRDRVVQGFPFVRANLSVPVSLADFAPGAYWPPTKLNWRRDRLEHYDRLYNGDFSRHLADPNSGNLFVNYFERIPTLIAAILLTSDPEVDEGEVGMVARFLSDAAVNAMVYGRAYLVRIGEELMSPQTTGCWDGEEDGTLFMLTLSTTADAVDGRPNRAHLAMIDADGETVVTRTQSWQGGALNPNDWSTGGTFGPILEGPNSDPGTFACVDRPPRRDGWGKSLFDLIGPIVVALAARMAGIERTVAQHEEPMLAIPIANADTATALGSGDGPSTLGEFTKPAVVKAAQALRDHSVIWSPDGVRQPTYIEYDGAMSASFDLVNQLLEELAQMTGLTRAMIGGDELPSGIAMKRLLFSLWASTRALQTSLHEAGQTVYGSSFEWPNAFEVDEEMDDPMAEDGTGEPLDQMAGAGES